MLPYLAMAAPRLSETPDSRVSEGLFQEPEHLDRDWRLYVERSSRHLVLPPEIQGVNDRIRALVVGQQQRTGSRANFQGDDSFA